MFLSVILSTPLPLHFIFFKFSLLLPLFLCVLLLFLIQSDINYQFVTIICSIGYARFLIKKKGRVNLILFL